jgi:hypothetical protein
MITPMMLRAIALSTVLAVGSALSGCATPPATVTQNADYGQFPTDYKLSVRSFLQTYLKDPESARVRYLTEPIKAYNRAAPIAGGNPLQFGYLVVVGVNAKNSYGGYTGEQPMRLLIKDDIVRAVIEPNPYFSEPWYQPQYPSP